MAVDRLLTKPLLHMTSQHLSLSVTHLWHYLECMRWRSQKRVAVTMSTFGTIDVKSYYILEGTLSSFDASFKPSSLGSIPVPIVSNEGIKHLCVSKTVCKQVLSCRPPTPKTLWCRLPLELWSQEQPSWSKFTSRHTVHTQMTSDSARTAFLSRALWWRMR